MSLIRLPAIVAVLVAIFTSGCQGFHFDGTIDVEPEVSDPSDDGHPKEKENVTQENGSSVIT